MKRSTFFKTLSGACLALSLALPLAAFAGAKEDIQADMRAGRWDQAEQRLDAVISQHPDSAVAHYWLAQVKFKQGYIDAAQAEVRRAHEIDPSDKFAGDKALLNRIEHAKVSASTAPVVSEPAQPAQDREATSPVLAQSSLPAPPHAAEPSGSHMLLWVILVMVGLGLLTWRLTRKRELDNVQQEKERWSGEIKDAQKDLGDAIAASDANPQNSPEVKLANYDRAKKAQADLAAHLGTLAQRQDYNETASLVMRARDIAADIRGEEKPSLRAERMEQERMAAMAEAQARQNMMGGPGYGPAYGPGYGPGHGSGVLGTVAAVGAGMALGSLLSGSAEAGTHRVRREDNDNGYQPFDDRGAGSDLDFGGSDSSGSWDSGGGVDTGGSGDF
ncbi:MAG: tetratricopeptide repeat protein [Burkholderiaceae bacterium]|nr:tetratricopeptide repeat protein [Burkholderiaceae bacterium]